MAQSALVQSTRGYPDGDPYVLVASSAPGPAGVTVPVTVVTRTGTARVAGASFRYVASGPGPPQAERVRLVGSRATVRWKPPASDGGSPISSYTVVALTAGEAPAGATVPASARSLVIGRIASNHLYTSRIVASNLAHGRGQWTSVGPLGATLGAAGYRLAAASGSVAGFGTLPGLGGVGGSLTSSSVTAIAGTPRGLGYWEVTSTGSVYAFGHARYYGRPGGAQALRGSVVGITSTPDGRGYYVVTSAGAVYGRGDAKVEGSAVGRAGGAAVAISVTPGSSPGAPGYWVLTSSRSVYRFGSAHGYGSASLGAPAVAMAPTPDGRGYWVVASSGEVRAFGDAHAEGRPGPRPGGFVGIATG